MDEESVISIPMLLIGREILQIVRDFSIATKQAHFQMTIKLYCENGGVLFAVIIRTQPIQVSKINYLVLGFGL